MEVFLLTKNIGKIAAAKYIFDKYNITLKNLAAEYPEIQGENSLEIACFSAEQAVKDFKVNVIREDHSLFINALGIPGPYTSYIEKRLSIEKILKILNFFKDRSGYFEVSTAFRSPDGDRFEHTFKVPVTFANEPRGDKSKGWNCIIKIGKESRTLTEYPEEERLHIWGQGYESLAKYLKSN